jgi:hypothetical protein
MLKHIFFMGYSAGGSETLIPSCCHIADQVYRWGRCPFEYRAAAIEAATTRWKRAHISMTRPVFALIPAGWERRGRKRLPVPR